MPKVEFDNDVDSYRSASVGIPNRPPASPQAGGMTGWLVSKGISIRVANFVLIGVVIAALAVTYFLLRGDASSPRPASLEYLYRVYGRP